MLWILILIGIIGYLFFRFKSKPNSLKVEPETEVIQNQKLLSQPCIKQPVSINPKINIFTKKGRSLCNDFVVLDFETTGLSATDDKIIEIAAVRYINYEEIDSFTTLVNPGIPIPAGATEVNHITDEMVRHAPRIGDVLPDLIKFIGESIIIAHNASFDMGFFKWNAAQSGGEISNPVIDTLSVSRKMFPELHNHKLGTVVEHLGISINNAHRALNDAKATGQIMIHCLRTLEREHPVMKLQPTKAVQPERMQKMPEEKTAAFEIIKSILLNHEKQCSDLCCRETKSYLVIENEGLKWFLRIKLDGKKKFVATDLDAEMIQEWVTDYQVEGNTSVGRSRVLINSHADLERLEKLVVACYEQLENQSKPA
ncbi:exonuclease domain-containing protein [Candidatus Formimonas warabiya]|uniref:Exonuclease domain-containing protein n=1 Tax=Formimonas warabiya TaxID=1761012 RepID=A0A3G1KQ26_FORW1|nr:exonuclease domain-containing protein [Candidatus Formimonas warabiya]ATW24579.1 hypothetical protein DCMF_07085 [Candidatus Formimonas warabiya]